MGKWWSGEGGGGRNRMITSCQKEEKNNSVTINPSKLNLKFNTKFNKLNDDYENSIIKKVLQEHQIFLENTRYFLTKNNIFLSGIPNEITINNEDEANHVVVNHGDIIHRILSTLVSIMRTIK